MNSKPSSDHQRGGALPSVPTDVFRCNVIKPEGRRDPYLTLEIGPYRFDSAVEFEGNYYEKVRLAYMVRDEVRAIWQRRATTTGATDARAPTSQISPPAVDAVAAPMTPSAVVAYEWDDMDYRTRLSRSLPSVEELHPESTVRSLVYAPQAAPDSAAPSAEMAKWLEFEAWSWIRKLLSQGGDIWVDHQDKSHELYSIRLDGAARERRDELVATLAPMLPAQTTNACCVCGKPADYDYCIVPEQRYHLSCFPPPSAHEICRDSRQGRARRRGRFCQLRHHTREAAKACASGASVDRKRTGRTTAARARTL